MHLQEAVYTGYNSPPQIIWDLHAMSLYQLVIFHQNGTHVSFCIPDCGHIPPKTEECLKNGGDSAAAWENHRWEQLAVLAVDIILLGTLSCQFCGGGGA